MNDMTRRTITSLGELNRLPAKSVIRVPQDYTMERLSDGWWTAAVDHSYQPNEKWLPATVLYIP